MNNVAFFEIHTDDPKRAMDFYTNVFGWKFFQEPSAPTDYWQIESESINGGLLKRPLPALAAGVGANAFVCSVRVADFDEIAELILTSGGKVALEKFPIPGKCWQGYFIDTEGNTFGLFQVDEHAA